MEQVETWLQTPPDVAWLSIIDFFNPARGSQDTRLAYRSGSDEILEKPETSWSSFRRRPRKTQDPWRNMLVHENGQRLPSENLMKPQLVALSIAVEHDKNDITQSFQ